MDLIALQERRRRKAAVAAVLLKAETGNVPREPDSLVATMGRLSTGMTGSVVHHIMDKNSELIGKTPFKITPNALQPGSFRASALAARDVRSWRVQRAAQAVRKASQPEPPTKPAPDVPPQSWSSNLNQKSTASAFSFKAPQLPADPFGMKPPRPPSRADAAPRPSSLASASASAASTSSMFGAAGFGGAASDSARWPSPLAALQDPAALAGQVFSRLAAANKVVKPIEASPAAHNLLRRLAQAIRTSRDALYGDEMWARMSERMRFLCLEALHSDEECVYSESLLKTLYSPAELRQYSGAGARDLEARHWRDCLAIYQDLEAADKAKSWPETVCAHLEVSNWEQQRDPLAVLPRVWRGFVQDGEPKAVAAAVAGVRTLYLTREWDARGSQAPLILGELEPLTCAALFAVVQLMMEVRPERPLVKPYQLYSILSYLEPQQAAASRGPMGYQHPGPLAAYTRIERFSKEHLENVASRFQQQPHVIFANAWKVKRHELLLPGLAVGTPGAMAAAYSAAERGPAPAAESEYRARGRAGPFGSADRAGVSYAGGPSTASRAGGGGGDAGLRQLVDAAAAVEEDSRLVVQHSDDDDDEMGTLGIRRRYHRYRQPRLDDQSSDSDGGGSANGRSKSRVSAASTASTVRVASPVQPAPWAHRSSTHSPLHTRQGPPGGSVTDSAASSDGGGDGGGGDGTAERVARAMRRDLFCLASLECVDPDLDSAIAADLDSRRGNAAAAAAAAAADGGAFAGSPDNDDDDSTSFVGVGGQGANAGSVSAGTSMGRHPGAGYKLELLAVLSGMNVMLPASDDLPNRDTAVLECLWLRDPTEGNDGGDSSGGGGGGGMGPSQLEGRGGGGARAAVPTALLQLETLKMQERGDRRIAQLSGAFQGALAGNRELRRLSHRVLPRRGRPGSTLSGPDLVSEPEDSDRDVGCLYRRWTEEEEDEEEVEGGGDSGRTSGSTRDGSGVGMWESEEVGGRGRGMGGRGGSEAILDEELMPVAQISSALELLRPGLLEKHPGSWGKLVQAARKEEELNGAGAHCGMAIQPLRLALLGLLLLAHRPDLPLRLLRLVPCVAAGRTYKEVAIYGGGPAADNRERSRTSDLPDVRAHYFALTTFAMFNFLPGRLHCGGASSCASVAAAAAAAAKKWSTVLEVNCSSPLTSLTHLFGRTPEVWAAIGLYVAVQVLSGADGEGEGVENPWLFTDAGAGQAATASEQLAQRLLELKMDVVVAAAQADYGAAESLCEGQDAGSDGGSDPSSDRESDQSWLYDAATSAAAVHQVLAPLAAQTSSYVFPYGLDWRYTPGGGGSGGLQPGLGGLALDFAEGPNSEQWFTRAPGLVPDPATQPLGLYLPQQRPKPLPGTDGTAGGRTDGTSSFWPNASEPRSGAWSKAAHRYIELDPPQRQQMFGKRPGQLTAAAATAAAAAASSSDGRGDVARAASGGASDDDSLMAALDWYTLQRNAEGDELQQHSRTDPWVPEDELEEGEIPELASILNDLQRLRGLNSGGGDDELQLRPGGGLTGQQWQRQQPLLPPPPPRFPAPLGFPTCDAEAGGRLGGSGGAGRPGGGDAAKRQLGGSQWEPRRALPALLRVWRCAAARGGGYGEGEQAGAAAGLIENVITVGGPGMMLALTAMDCGEREHAKRFRLDAPRTRGADPSPFLHSVFQPAYSAKTARMVLGLEASPPEQAVFPPPKGVPGVALLTLRPSVAPRELIDRVVTEGLGGVALGRRDSGGRGGSAGAGGGAAARRGGVVVVSRRSGYGTAEEQARRALVTERSGALRVQAHGLEGLETAVLLLAQVRSELNAERRDLAVVLRQVDFQGIAAADDDELYGTDEQTIDITNEHAAAVASIDVTGEQPEENDENTNSRCNGAASFTAAECRTSKTGGGSRGGEADKALKLLKKYDDCISQLQTFLPAVHQTVQRIQPGVDSLDELYDLDRLTSGGASSFSGGGAGLRSSLPLFGAPTGSKVDRKQLADVASRMVVCIETAYKMYCEEDAVRAGVLTELVALECEFGKPDRLVLPLGPKQESGRGTGGDSSTGKKALAAAAAAGHRDKGAGAKGGGGSGSGGRKASGQRKRGAAAAAAAEEAGGSDAVGQGKGGKGLKDKHAAAALNLKKTVEKIMLMKSFNGKD